MSDYLGGETGEAEAILQWSDAMVEAAERGRGKVPPSVRYHVAEYRRQGRVEKIAAPLLRAMRLSPRAHILDVGCGAGQTLRRLTRFCPARLVGVDTDPEALAFGERVARRHSLPIELLRASAHELPFPEETFTHVFCRDALTFMHQETALSEMARVLRRGGHLYVYVEGPAYDLHLMRTAPDWKSAVCRCRDLCYGVGLHLSGLQPRPRGRWTGGRAFGTASRLSAMLRGRGLEVVETRPAGGWPGLPWKVELVARRKPHSL